MHMSSIGGMDNAARSAKCTPAMMHAHIYRASGSPTPAMMHAHVYQASGSPQLAHACLYDALVHKAAGSSVHKYN
jgi:hypothetical protein